MKSSNLAVREALEVPSAVHAVAPTSPDSRVDPATRTAAGPARFRVAEDDDLGEVMLRLRGELDLAAVPVLKDSVRRAGRRDGLVVVDLSGVVFVDVAGLSAISALVRESLHDGWALDLRHPSLSIRQLARLTGMTHLWHEA
jgi:anti-anti-sigma factor